MADLTNTTRWIRYVPDLFANRELEKPFWLELHGSMSKEQLRNLETGLSAPLPSLEPLPEAPTQEQTDAREELLRLARVKQYADALGSFIRLGKEPLTVNGERVDTLEKYFDVATRAINTFDAFLEPWRALIDINRLAPRSSFSLGRLSGGFTSTTTPRSANGGGQTAAR